MKTDRLLIEEGLWRRGYRYIAGVDEVGRGPLAGPVFACAIIFKRYFFLQEVKDSKKIPAIRRLKLGVVLRSKCLCHGIGEASVSEIDKLNIRQATFLAMKRALQALRIEPDFVLIDGEDLPGVACDSMGVTGGDDKSFTIGAASIVAKTERDEYMCRLDSQYPAYRFCSNKGYGTQEHIRILKSQGASEHHRKTFLRKILPEYL